MSRRERDDEKSGVIIFSCRPTSTLRCACGRTCTKRCDFPLRGTFTGKTCSKPLCDACAVIQTPGRDFCRSHHEYTQRGTK